jgi:hypothetical protein
MAKKIELIINNCSECPYSEYDNYYSMSTNSGWDCKLTGERIATDIGAKVQDLSTLPIHNKCPLKDVDIAYVRKEKINEIFDK